MGKVLLTGAAGMVGRMIRPYLRERYGEVVLSDRHPVSDLEKGESFRLAELSDAGAVGAMMEGIDRIVHLGGQPVEAPWEVVLQSNIIGLHNVYEAARKAGVRRIAFASTNHTIGFYSRKARISTRDRTRPDTRYGLSKVFGEEMASLYADKHGIGTLSIRIGNVDYLPADERRLSIWQHPEDFVQLCAIAFEHPDIHNQIVWGASDNARSWWDMSENHRLGYRPKHRAEDHRSHALANVLPPDPVGDLFQGSVFCADEFSGDVEKVLNS